VTDRDRCKESRLAMGGVEPRAHTGAEGRASSTGAVDRESRLATGGAEPRAQVQRGVRLALAQSMRG